ncbi:hypothetical protein A8B75_19895 [Sphingomonadales bacterium EhC05]|nr:hypothetical protein A8B75_19895 [Sphingomonadales bacterium EhC05]
MASEKSLNQKNLTALGAQRLAQLLLELANGDAVAKRRLRLELASKGGGGEVAREVRKRLSDIAKSRAFVDWQKKRVLAYELMMQLKAITEHVAPTEPATATDLLWQFLALSQSLYERCDDSNGTISDIMYEALEELARIALIAKSPPAQMADRVFDAMCDNGYGQYDGIITLMAAPLGKTGLTNLKDKFENLAKSRPKEKERQERESIGFGKSDPIYDDDFEVRHRPRLIQSALAEIADALGDVDGYIARYSEDEQRNPAIAARIAERLLKAGRVEDAAVALGKAKDARSKGGHWPDWDRLNIEYLESSGQVDAAQGARWKLFETDLQSDYLKAYLKKLPDFDDLESEERALAHAQNFPQFHHGLHFLLSWPALDRAAEMILTRGGEVDGNHYELLTSAAREMELRHPLAATIALRAMIDFALDKGRYKRYPHAARHLRSCGDLVERIEDFRSQPNHETYLASLKARHGRKSAFWNA